MHGRLKVRTTEEQQAAKAKERAAKVEKLTKAKQFIFATMGGIETANTTVRQQLNRITAEVLSNIPEFHTIWNVRKRLLLKTKTEILEKLTSAVPAVQETSNESDIVKEDSSSNDNDKKEVEKLSSEQTSHKDVASIEAEVWSELSKLLKSELQFIVECIRQQPKAYPIWYHRIWLYSRFLDAVESQKLSDCLRMLLEDDLRLTELLLSQDERNFHCWEYRRFVLAHLNQPAKQELSFVHQRIANNFSNYSAWHQRCMLLFEEDCRASNTKQQKMDFSAFLTVFNDEFELLENAFYTDPADQSSWCYYRWLLGKAVEHMIPQPTVLRSAFINHIPNGQAELVLVLNEGLARDELLGTLRGVASPLADMLCSCDWRAVQGASDIVSCVWFTLVDSNFNVADAFPSAAYVHREFARFQHTDDVSSASFNSAEYTALRQVLGRHAESFNALAELESENESARPDAAAKRNCMLTQTFLLEQLDATAHADTIRRNYADLARIDSDRRSVYETMRARFDLQRRVNDSGEALASRTIDLSSLDLSRVSDCRSFAFVTTLSLRANQLTGPFDARAWNSLRALKRLDLSANRITCLTGLEVLCSLRALNLSNNLLTSGAQFAPLGQLHLEELDITLNPFAQRYAQLHDQSDSEKEEEKTGCAILRKIVSLQWI